MGRSGGRLAVLVAMLLAGPGTLAVTAETAAQPAGPATLTVRGALTYLPRIALPPESVAVVGLREVTAAAGTPLLETRLRLDGRQVPIPFELRVARDRLDPAAGWVVQGAVLAGGRALWLSEPVAVDVAAAAEVELGELRMQPHRPIAFAARLACGGVPVSFGLDRDTPVLAVAGERFRLRPAVAASGARYEAEGDPTTVFWGKGEDATVELRGVRLAACGRAAEDGTALRATGNEPSWLLRIGGEQLTLALDFGTRTVLAATPPVTLGPDGTARYAASAAGRKLTVTVAPSVCADTMTGMPHPFTVTVAHDDAVLHGCGGDPGELLRGKVWTVASLAGTPVEPATAPTLEFGADGRVAGKASCNRFGAGYTLTGETLRFAQAFSTMMACPDAAMAQERAFLDLLAKIARFRIEPDGALVLEADDGGSILARAG